MSKRAVAFVATGKPEESRKFYSQVLELRFLEESEFAIVFDAFGTTLRVQKAGTVTPAPYTAFGLEVDALDEAVDALIGKGVVGVRYSFFEQDARGIWSAPDGARVFWFHDPDGNLLSLNSAART